MADKYQTELTRSLKSAGFVTVKLADVHFNSKGKKVYPTKGRPDSFFAGRGLYGGFVEAKTGRGVHQQRFDFCEWREDQREWYFQNALPHQASYWLFITLGRIVGGKPYPRVTLLITAERLLDVEKLATKKSMSYERAITLDGGRWLLVWAGDKCWTIPTTHPFNELFMEK